MLKRFISVFLSLVIFLSLSTSTFAAEYNSQNVFLPADTQDKALPKSEILNENGNIQLDNDAIEHLSEPILLDEITIDIPSQDNSDETNNRGSSSVIEQYLVRVGLKQSSGGQFTWWFNVDCPTSPISKPNITLTAQVTGNFVHGGSYSNVGSSFYHKYTTNADYSVNYTWKTPAKTGYYIVRCTLHVHDTGKIYSFNTGVSILNRTGNLWDFTFSDTGKTLPTPYANWVKGAIYTRPSNLADTYYATYENLTGKTLVRSLYDVHHIQPLSYGGNNNYNNLIHLPKSLHQKVTAWFAGY